MKLQGIQWFIYVVTLRLYMILLVDKISIAFSIYRNKVFHLSNTSDYFLERKPNMTINFACVHIVYINRVHITHYLCIFMNTIQ